MSAFTNIRESGLEALIVNWLVEQNGYEEGNNTDYNKEYAIDETRLFRFLEDTQPEQLEKLKIHQSAQKKHEFLNRLQGELAKRGVIDVLRKGVKIYPADLIMFYLTPTENNLKAKELSKKIYLVLLVNRGTPNERTSWHWISAYSLMGFRSLLLSLKSADQTKCR